MKKYIQNKFKPLSVATNNLPALDKAGKFKDNRYVPKLITTKSTDSFTNQPWPGLSTGNFRKKRTPKTVGRK